MPFNPALGTLTAVTGELTVTYTPYVTLSGGGTLPSPGIVSTTFFLNAGGFNAPPSTFPPQTVTPVNGAYIGTPTGVDIGFNFEPPSAFISSAPGPVQLADFGFNSNVENRDSFSPSDDTSFLGTLTLTYTYQAATTVPEPASLLILGFGAGIIPLLRRRSAA